MRFQLKMMMMHGNTAVMTLKHGAQEFKVATLCDALQFVATMEQHRMALISGGGRELYHELRDNSGHEWVLSCRYSNRIVLLEVWKQHPGSQDDLHTEFSWEGSVGEFDRAVKVISGKIK